MHILLWKKSSFRFVASRSTLSATIYYYLVFVTNNVINCICDAYFWDGKARSHSKLDHSTQCTFLNYRVLQINFAANMCPSTNLILGNIKTFSKYYLSWNTCHAWKNTKAVSANCKASFQDNILASNLKSTQFCILTLTPTIDLV